MPCSGVLVLVVVGSLAGEWLGIRDLLGDLWFWLGNQGWEYLELGRFWQVLLVVGLFFWFWLVARALQRAHADPELRPFVRFFLIAAFAMAYVLRELSSEAVWPLVEKCLRLSFWGLNGGLALMILLSLLPGGLLQLWDVLQYGYWHARSTAYTATPLARFVEWMRLWGDLVFIFLGALPLVIALLASYRNRWHSQERGASLRAAG